MKQFRNLILGLSLILGATNGFAQELVRSGEFFTVTPGDDVTGSASIEKDSDGRLRVVLSEDFESVAGPALYVVLHKEVVPSEYNDSNYVNLGMLLNFNGYQSYLIPEDVNIEDFKAVVIWCERFDVTFGSAELLSVH